MPIYTYRCRECGHEFDKLRKMTDDSVQKCEVCGGPVKRVYHPVGIIFKGSGFYSTDNAKKGNGERVKSNGSDDVKKDDEKSVKSEDKTAGSGEVKKIDEKKAETKKS